MFARFIQQSNVKTSSPGDPLPRANATASAEVLKAMLQLKIDRWTDSIIPKTGDHFYVPLLKSYMIANPDVAYDLLVHSPMSRNKGSFYNKNIGDAIGNSVFTNVGDEWKFTRRLLGSDFSKNSIGEIVPGMSYLVARHLDSWRKLALEKRPLNMSHVAFELTFDFIGSFLFKRNLSFMFEEVHSALSALTRLVELRFLGPMRHIPLWAPLPVFQQGRAARQTLKRLIRQLVDDMEAGTVNPDLAERFSQAQVVEKLLEQEKINERNMDWVQDESAVLLVAGHETTAVGTMWMFYALAQNPELQERLFDELSGVDLDGDFKSFWNTLILHQWVVKESLRLYPPAPIIGRRSDEEMQLCGRFVPKNTHLGVLVFAIHKHPEYWSRPEEFFPDRFSESGGKSIHPGAYLPFSLGPRRCTGEYLALVQMIVILAHFVRHFRFRLANSSPVHGMPLFTLRPSEDIELILEPRE